MDYPRFFYETLWYNINGSNTASESLSISPKAEIVIVGPLKGNKSGLIGWKWLDGLVYHCTVDALPEILKTSLGTQSERQRENY